MLYANANHREHSNFLGTTRVWRIAIADNSRIPPAEVLVLV